MLMSLERKRSIISNAIWYFPIANIFCIGMLIIALSPIQNIRPEWAKSILLITLMLSFIFGFFVKYRLNTCPEFLLFHTVHYILCFQFAIGGSSMVLSQKLLSLANGQPVTLIYLISIALSLSIGIFFGAKNHNVDAQNHKNLSPKNKRSKYLSRYKLLIIALSVNIPMIFQFFTGKMENILFLAIPLITIGAAWSNIETFGPHIYALLSLIKNKSATGHGFANADYEKIQELRRTFFLSRWLMKDYKPRNPQKII